MNKDYMRPIEYRMTKTAFQELLKTRGPEDMRMNPYSFVMKALNEQGGLRGNVKRISLV